MTAATQEKVLELLKELTAAAIGEGGDPDSLVMIMIVANKAVKEERLVDASRLLFRTIQYAYQNSPTYVTDVMVYIERTEQRFNQLLEDRSE